MTKQIEMYDGSDMTDEEIKELSKNVAKNIGFRPISKEEAAKALRVLGLCTTNDNTKRKKNEL